MITRQLIYRGVTALLAGLLAGILFSILQAAAEASDIPADPARAHAYADAILRPQFQAAFNKWTYGHPVDRVEGSWDHTLKLDKGDAERWRDVEESFEQLRKAMRRSEGR